MPEFFSSALSRSAVSALGPPPSTCFLLCRHTTQPTPLPVDTKSVHMDCTLLATAPLRLTCGALA